MNDFSYIKDDSKIRIQIKNEIKSFTKQEFINLVEDEKLSISSCGVLYKTDEKGVIPDILTHWYKYRKETKNKAIQFKKDGKNEEYEYNNRLQYTYKIMLNSAYGAIGTKIFRYYDKDGAESVTISGQDVIKSAIKYFNSLYNKELDNKTNKDYVICSDTDSIYLTDVDLLKKNNLTTIDECKKYCISKTLEQEKIINEFFDVLCFKAFNVKTHYIKMSPEKLCLSGFWINAKKRYALLKIYDFESNQYVDKIDITGFDVVRSSFPLKFKECMKTVLEKILKKEEKSKIDEYILNFKSDLNNYSLLDISKITSVNFKSNKKDKDYNPKNRIPFEIILGTPFQVKSALYYNDLIDLLKLNKKWQKIISGQKIKCIYLKQNKYNMDCIALKLDGMNPEEILNFVEMYVDRNKMYEKELKGKLESFYEALNWEFPIKTSKSSNMFFEL